MTDTGGIQPGTPAHEGLKLAGFALAHAAWSLEDGPGMVPIGLSREGGETASQRFVMEATRESIPTLWEMVGSRVGDGEWGVLAFESREEAADGRDVGVINAHLVGHQGDLVATVRQAFVPAQKSRLPGRSRPFTILGTPVPSAEIDLPGTREAILLGVMSHPQGERLFPQLAGFAREMIAAADDMAGE